MLVFDSIILPFAAVLFLEFIERTRDESPARRWLDVAWDLCVLAAGAAPGIFASQKAVAMFGPEMAVRFGYVYLFLALIVGVFVSRIKKHQYVGGMEAFIGILVGGFVAGALAYIGW